jgi:hypothetical protein
VSNTSCRSGLRFAFNLFTLLFLVIFPHIGYAQTSFFPLKDVRPGLRGTGRTVFHGNQVEEFEVQILGVLENLTPKQAIILAKLSGGPLEQTGVMQGMSGSPVYIDGKLLGAIALGFPFSKQPIAGIQPIEQMVADSPLPGPGNVRPAPFFQGGHYRDSPLRNDMSQPLRSSFDSIGNLTEIFTPLALSGFTSRTVQTFAAEFHKLGLDPQQGVSAGTPKSQSLTGTVVPGSMISVQLLSGDFAISADGTVTYVDGKRVYAFGHRFLDSGGTDLPFARADVIALLPTLNSSFKLSAAREWVGSITSDRNTAIAGEMGRPARTIPLTITVHSGDTSTHNYQMQVVNDRLLTPFITQTAIFSTIDATERTLGAGTLRLRGQVDFEGSVPPLALRDIFVSDSGLVQQVSVDAVVQLGFLLGAGFKDLRIQRIRYDLQPIESKQQLRIAQVWTSHAQVRPGESVGITALLQGENGFEMTRTASYQVPVGAPEGPLNFTVSDAITLNAPDFAGITQSSLHSPAQVIATLNAYRGSEAAYLRVWRQQPAFTISGPLPGGEITDPPPSVALILADPSSSPTSNAAQTLLRGSQVAEVQMPVDNYVVTGSKTVQVEVKD